MHRQIYNFIYIHRLSLSSLLLLLILLLVEKQNIILDPRLLFSVGGDENLVARWRGSASDDSHSSALASRSPEVSYGDALRGSSR
jgi:hypothetical protein